MSLFDRRTDTEKELDAYRNSHPKNNYPSNVRGAFDTQNKSDNYQNDMQSDNYNYGNGNNNNFYDSTGYNKNGYFKSDISLNNVSNIPENQNQKKGSGVGSVLMIVWFFISMLAFIVLAMTGQAGWCIIVFGQMFVVFGIISFCTKDKSKKDENKKGKKKSKSGLLSFILLLIGAGIILVCLFYMFADEWLINSFNKNVVSVLVCSIFLVIGLVMLYFGIVKPIKDKARCTVYVDSEVIDIKRRLSSDSDGSSWVYAPVYRYYYQGQQYTGCSDIYSSSVPRVGTQHKLRINPYNPNDFIDPKRMMSVSILFIIMGVAFAGAGIMAISAVLSAG